MRQRLAVSLASALLLSAGVCAPRAEVRVPRAYEQHRSLHPARSLGRETAIAAIANKYALHLTPEATAAQLAANATVLAKLLAWAKSTPNVQSDVLAAITQLQAENDALTARLAKVPAAPPALPALAQ